MAAWELAAFDLYGTLLDIAGLAARMRPVAGEGAAALLARWRKAQLERTWTLNREGRYEPWDRVTLEALGSVAPDLSTRDRHSLCELWLTVPAFPDAGPALAQIRGLGVRTAVLSNGTRLMIEAALLAAGLEIDRVLSADDVRVFKTDPRVYALLDAEGARERTLFVSANGWDAAGAGREGRLVAWLDRGGEPPDTAPTYRARSLSRVADILRWRPPGA